MANHNEYDFFFSYRRKDMAVAKQLVTAIKQQRNPKTGKPYTVWFDENEKDFGVSLERQIEEAIQHTNTLFILISEGGIDGYQELEIAYAKKQYSENPLRFVVAMSPGIDIGLRNHQLLAFLENPILIGENTDDANGIYSDLQKWLDKKPLRYEQHEVSSVLGNHGHKLVNRNHHVKDFRKLMGTAMKQPHYTPQFFFMYGEMDDQMHSLVDRLHHYELPAVVKQHHKTTSFKQAYLGQFEGTLDDPDYDLAQFNAMIERVTNTTLNSPAASTDLARFSGDKGINFMVMGVAKNFSSDALLSLQKIVEYWTSAAWSFTFPVHFFVLIEGSEKKGMGRWFSKDIDQKKLHKVFNAFKEGKAHTMPVFEQIEQEHVRKWRAIDPTLLRSTTLAQWISEFFKHKDKRSMLEVENELEQTIKDIRNQQTIK